MWTVHFHKRQAFFFTFEWIYCLRKVCSHVNYIRSYFAFVHIRIRTSACSNIPLICQMVHFACIEKKQTDTQATFTYSRLIVRLIFHLLACACELHWAAQDNSKRTGEYERLWGCIFFNCSFANLLRHCHTRLKQESYECFYCTPGNVNELLWRLLRSGERCFTATVNRNSQSLSCFSIVLWSDLQFNNARKQSNIQETWAFFFWGGGG